MRTPLAKLIKARIAAQDALPPRVDPRIKPGPKSAPYKTLIERADEKKAKKEYVEDIDTKWRGWKARYPDLQESDHKLCKQCQRILNLDNFKRRGSLCNWCKANNKFERQRRVDF